MHIVVHIKRIFGKQPHTHNMTGFETVLRTSRDNNIILPYD